MKIRPLGDRVLVEPVEEEQKVGGIYIPDAAKEKPIKGKVLAIGKKVDKENKEIPFNVKVGQSKSSSTRRRVRRFSPALRSSARRSRARSARPDAM